MKFRRDGKTWQWIAGQLCNEGVPAQGYVGDVYYIDGKASYDPEAEEDQALHSEEDEHKVKLYASAIEELALEDRRYASNYNLFQKWDTTMRLWWINQIEKQANDGKQTIGVEVVTRAVIIRLTRS